MANIVISGGTGSSAVVNGSYSVGGSFTGYDNTSINPSTVNVVDGTDTYAFTIAATGTLTLHVSETGESTGTAVVGATFNRTDASGNIYGAVITTDSNGDAVFENVPFSATGAPNIYYKQITSDGSHNFSTTVASTTLTSATGTIEIINEPAVTKTFNMTDTNYANLPIDSGTITLS